MSDSVSIDIEKSKKSQDEPHDMEISPDGKCLVTYSDKSKTIVWWDVEDIKEGKYKVEFIKEFKHEQNNTAIANFGMCVSDKKTLGYFYHRNNRNDKIGKYDYYFA